MGEADFNLCNILRGLDFQQKQFVDITDRLGEYKVHEELLEFYEYTCGEVTLDVKEYFKTFDSKDFLRFSKSKKEELRKFIIEDYPTLDFKEIQRKEILLYQDFPCIIDAILGKSTVEKYLDSLRPTFIGLIPYFENIDHSRKIGEISEIISTPKSFERKGILDTNNLTSIGLLLSGYLWALNSVSIYPSVVNVGYVAVIPLIYAVLKDIKKDVSKTKLAYDNAKYLDAKIKELFIDEPTLVKKAQKIIYSSQNV